MALKICQASSSYAKLPVTFLSHLLLGVICSMRVAKNNHTFNKISEIRPWVQSIYENLVGFHDCFHVETVDFHDCFHVETVEISMNVFRLKQ